MNSILSNLLRRKARASVPWLGAFVIVAFLLGCQEQPVGPDLTDVTDVDIGFKKGRPAQCNAGTDLSITFGDGSLDALRSDGNGAYEENVENVGAHINDPTGNLMLWTSQYGEPSRAVLVTTTAFNGSTTDRIFTNNHDNSPDGNSACGLGGMAIGSTGSAVLEAELNSGGIDNGIVRYGKDCDGNDVNRVTTTRPIAGVWTITGSSGVHCVSNGRKGKNAGFDQVGTAGPFSMTLLEAI